MQHMQQWGGRSRWDGRCGFSPAKSLPEAAGTLHGCSAEGPGLAGSTLGSVGQCGFTSVTVRALLLFILLCSFCFCFLQKKH